MFKSIYNRIKRFLMINHKDEHRPVRQEMLVRSMRYKSDYHLWLEQNKQEELLKNIYISFMLRKLNIAGDVPLHAFSHSDSNNLIVHYIDTFGKLNFNYLFDYLKDRTIRLGYMLYLSDRQIIERSGYIEKIERHLLRPHFFPIHLGESKDQLYGNVTITLVFINDRPLYLSIESSQMLENDYKLPYTFDELAEVLFT